MELAINGMAALVLGGTQGLGLACAETLAEAGCALTIVGRDAGRGEASAGKLGENAHFIACDLAQAEARIVASVPVGRLGLAEDFGPLCAFLYSRRAGYITGRNITVDGGLVRALL